MKNCKICGRVFAGQTSGQFCPDCKAFITNKQGRRKNKQKPEGQRRVSLVERYLQARKEGTDGGLSYGYWVAREQAGGDRFGARDKEALLGMQQT